MIKIGVLGVGHLGRIHLRLLKEIAQFDLVGFYDPDDGNAGKAVSEFGVRRFTGMEELIEAADAIDVVTPTIHHYDCASRALKLSRHVFIEKPLANTIKEAKKLHALATEADVKVQVGHVERFNPAFTAALPYFNQPLFIETHRLAQFNPRGTDVSVVLDLMIHDIDIVLSVVRSTVRRISASGVAVVSDSPDITNARIEFDNGCVANLTASRISMKNMRKTRFFQKDAYISVDFLEKQTSVIRMKTVEGEPDPLAVTIDLGKDKGLKQIFFENPNILATNAIKAELESFAQAILNDSPPPVTIDDGYNALDVAYKIIEKINHTSDFIGPGTIKG
ncbi:MAG: Gfo/Idh/MocA family oxidoreductase [Bacteroidota bacterium]